MAGCFPIIYAGDCLPVLGTLVDNSVHAVITDPPYGLSDHSPAEVIQALTAWAAGDRERVPDGKGFMGRQWDRFVPPPAVWDQCYRALRPGGHMAVFAGSRTVDLMGLSIRLAGFEIRDTITWCYSNGFPKSRDISKDMDKMAGAERALIGLSVRADGTTRPHATNWSDGMGYMGNPGSARTSTAPATEAAKQWDGWGTALKPASEPILIARKPFKGTIAANVLAHGTGGMNINGCRVATSAADAKAMERANSPSSGRMKAGGSPIGTFIRSNPTGAMDTTAGRWPPNLVLSHASTEDGEDACAEGCVEGCPVAELDAQSAGSRSDKPSASGTVVGSGIWGIGGERHCSVSGGASRFYPIFRYQAKAPTSQRPKINGKAHPTVKPLALMEWLATLFTTPGGLIVDPFAGTGTLGQAAQNLGYISILIENDPESVPYIYQRLGLAAPVIEAVS
jgi:DNA modification methylase